MKATPATPLYRVGTPVRYVDHHGRVQTGKIKHAEASWWGGDTPPFIRYTVEHPTYRHKQMHCAEDDIMESFPK